MSAPCAICTHPAREKLDAMLRDGASVRVVSIEAGCSKSAVDRHKHRHMGEAGQGAETSLPVEVLTVSTCPPVTASEPDPMVTRWRVVAPVVRFLRSDRSQATATAGEIIGDVHDVFARALEASRSIVPVRMHPTTEGAPHA